MVTFMVASFLSTPSARRATCDCGKYTYTITFLSTPSARRATMEVLDRHMSAIFLSTPSARRATVDAVHLALDVGISIHALREEGDISLPG